MAALSGEKTLAELSSEFGVHPTMISTWKQELIKRASELFARGNKAPAVDDAQKSHRRSAPQDRPVAGRTGFSCRAARHLPSAERRAMITPNAALSVKPAMHAARDRAQQLLLPAAADVGGGTRSAQPARPDFHRASGVWQSADAGDAVARRDPVGRRRIRRLMRKLGLCGDQAEAQHQQAASRAQDLSLSAARQDDRSAEPGMGNRHHVHPDAAGISVSGRDHRLGDQAGSVLASVEHPDGGVLRRGPRAKRSPNSAGLASSTPTRVHNSPARHSPGC